MNPIDHPHGGGHGKDHGGRYTSLTPWGKPTKGLRTRDVHKKNKLIVKRRFEE
jgi:large subunit ribosomal protein L2